MPDVTETSRNGGKASFKGRPMHHKLSVRLFAEALGSALLVATVVGSGLMATGLSRDAGIQLAANAAATGAMLVMLITILAPVSGAHLNPAVSLVFAIRRELSVRDLMAYVAAQCAGGILGTALAHSMFGLPPLAVGVAQRGTASLLLSEAVATFTLVLAILGTLAARPERVATTVALTIVGAYWFTASTSFANPAVTLARAFTDSFSGIAPMHVPGFALMQIAGALAAMAAANALFRSTKPS